METYSTGWLEEFKEIIIAYNRKRQPDPFMRWFRDKESKNFFLGNNEKALTILIDARFDQMTTAEKALENTKKVVESGCLAILNQSFKCPALISRQYFTSEEWTKSFVGALPCLHTIANTIVKRKTWRADELSNLMLYQIKAPYLGVKTTRLAIRWLHELMPDLNIDMRSYEIPIDRLVYRVSARLGIIDPELDKYFGNGSDADVKIQRLVQKLLPGQQWIFDEPLWSTGRKASSGGHCYPTSPKCYGCMFERICPKNCSSFDPVDVGMPNGKGEKDDTSRKKIGSRKESQQQIEYAKFVTNLRRLGVTGEIYRERIAQWNREHPWSQE